MKEKRNKKIKFSINTFYKKLISSIIYVCVMFIILYESSYLIHKIITKKNYFEIFGISFFTAENNSMKNDFRKNDLLIVKKVDTQNLKENDIIAYEINGKIRINKIFNIHKDDNKGEIFYITKSNLNIHPDIEKVYPYQIIGKEIENIWGFGSIIRILQSRFFSTFLILFLILIFIYNKKLYIRKKKRIRKKESTSKV